MIVMREELVQFIWQHRLFDVRGLVTSCGKRVQILHPGKWNRHQGPDFELARIQLDDVLLVGNVEIHVHSNDWYAHGHTGDKHYKNVILHVVHTINGPLLPDIPSLEIGSRIAHTLLQRYNRLMEAQTEVFCKASVRLVPELVLKGWLDRLLTERIESKVLQIEKQLTETTYNWNLILWQMILGQAAPGINATIFEQIAGNIPFISLIREHHIPARIEAAFMGVAGLLNDTFQDAYPIMLQREFQLLQRKYGLKQVHGALSFLRMRPAGFPTIRLSQLAALFRRQPMLFDGLLQCDSVEDALQLFHTSVNDYWLNHYLPDKPASFMEKPLGRHMQIQLEINVVIPLLFSYATTKNDVTRCSELMEWMYALPAEQNKVVSQYRSCGFPAKHAAHTQGLLQLKRYYCAARRCLSCAVGLSILKQSSTP
jgi:hypothetical protein